jgi:hypothetical protein
MLMAAALFFKCHSLGLQAQSDAAREVFPQVLIGVLIELPGKPEVGSFSLLFKHPATANKQFSIPK